MSMRLPTISQFKTQVAQISGQYSRASTLQMQISTGKKIQQSSDDPRLASQIQSVQDYLDRLNGYENNTILAQNRLAMSGSVLQQVNNLSIKAQELLVQAQNGTLNNSDRSAIALELSGILDSMVALANSQDGNGEYLFNGVAGGPAYVKNGNEFEYQGTYEGNVIAIGEKTQVPYNQSGFSVFGDIQSGTGLFSVAGNSNNAGTGLLASVTALNTSTINKDHYTLSMVTNAAGKLAYQVVDDTTGLMVIPVAPADAPEYISGSTLTFNGISTQLSGAPEVGDSFTIAPSKTQSVFKTLQNVIGALNTPVTSSQSRAAVNQVLIQESASFNGAFNHLVDESTRCGMRAQHIDNQMNLNKDNILQQKIYLSSLSDVDLPEAISNLSLQLTSLEMSQQSYTKLQELFNHLMSQQI